MIHAVKYVFPNPTRRDGSQKADQIRKAMALLDSGRDRGAIECEAFGTACAEGGEEGLVLRFTTTVGRNDVQIRQNLEAARRRCRRRRGLVHQAEHERSKPRACDGRVRRS